MEDKPQLKPVSPVRNIMTKVALVIMLVVLPIMSWFYLNKGADFYRGVMAELGEYGKLPAFSFDAGGGEKITAEEYDKRLSVFHFPSSLEDADAMGSMKHVQAQFNDHAGVQFVSFVPGSKDTLLSPADSDENWRYIQGDAQTLQRLKSELAIPNELADELPPLEQTLILVDTNSIIRNYYPIADTSRLNRMITTMSLLMPRKPKARIEYEYEKEK